MFFKEPENCWEYWKCDKNERDKCPAYKSRNGNECWLIVSVLSNTACQHLKTRIKSCFECTWFNNQKPGYSTRVCNIK